MANRYGNQRRGYEDRGYYSNRSSDYNRGSGSDYGRNRYSSNYGGGYSSDYDRDDEYFGGNMQYGQGYSGGNYGSYDRDYEDEYSTGSYQGGRGSGRGNYYRDNNYGGSENDTDYDTGSYYGPNRSGSNYYGQESYNDYGGGGTYGGYSDRGYYGRGPRRGYSGQGNYSDSERGCNPKDRTWWDKTADEVSSWFGDEEAERRRRMDARQGQNRGRGPRNYKRSDERIKEDINDRLTDHYYLDASDIEVDVNNGEVVLTGTVDSRYAKRQAEDIAENVSGVTNVENRLRIRQYSSGQESLPSSTGISSGSTGPYNTGTTGSSPATGSTGNESNTTEIKGKSRTNSV